MTSVPAISNIQSAEKVNPASKIQRVAETALPGVTSRIQSGIGAAETAVSDAIEKWIPRNCSFGTKQFCVGFRDSKPSCFYFPFDISKIISAVPTEVANLLDNELQALKPLEGILATVPAMHIQVPLIIGLFSLLTLASLFAYSLFGRLYWIVKTYVLIGACLLCGLICVVLLGIPTVLFYDIQSNIERLGLNLGPDIRVEKGDVRDMLIGALACVFTMEILIVLSLILT